MFVLQRNKRFRAAVPSSLFVIKYEKIKNRKNRLKTRGVDDQKFAKLNIEKACRNIVGAAREKGNLHGEKVHTKKAKKRGNFCASVCTG